MYKFQLFLKRIIDIIGSLIGLILLLPIFIFVIIGILYFMPGPIFFKQERVGKNGRIFNIYKFRSMKVDLGAEKSFDFSRDNERLTKFGNFIRRFKLDELPQLLNILRGDMSLVGPRPTVKKQVDNYTDYQRIRLEMRPGLTGLAQVNGNIEIDWDKRIEYDVYYVRNFSIWQDIKIIFKTVLVVIFGEGKFKEE